MQKRKRPFFLLFTSWFAFGFLAYVIFVKSPDASTSLLHIQFQNIAFFFFFLFAGCYSLLTFVLNSQKRGFIYSLGILLFFALRFYKLTNPLYLVLLLLLLLGLELLFLNSKKSKTRSKVR